MTEQISPETENRLNNELLSAEPAEASKVDKKPKRNSKDDLTKKILQVVEKYRIDFEYSDTKLRRMSKTELQKLLASVMEQCVKIDMAKAAGVDPRSNGKVITMGALRMLHNLAATGFEKVYNSVGPRLTGYEIDGFAEALQDPMIASSVDECLAEIAKDNPEVLDYFDSAYTRLLLVWSGALLTCVKKRGSGINRNAPQSSNRMGPQPNQRPDAVRARGSWSEAMRKVDKHSAPSVPNVRSV